MEHTGLATQQSHSQASEVQLQSVNKYNYQAMKQSLYQAKRSARGQLRGREPATCSDAGQTIIEAFYMVVWTFLV